VVVGLEAVIGNHAIAPRSFQIGTDHLPHQLRERLFRRKR
jgi:hypothetical protein